MACNSCGSHKECRCGNPCGHQPHSTPTCESLPSQIENFTLQFFGTVVKTELNGQVVWSLPCNLDVGLPNNPRGIDEGLACYFLRLFHDGIVGLTGPQGIAGTNGANGNNAYTVTLRSFNQPSLESPIVQVVTQFNPAIIPGIYINIAGSGWYLVNETDGNGVLLLTLVRGSDGASGSITAGKLVVPSGFPGASIQGPQGPQGPKGQQGATGESETANNDMYYATSGTDWPLPNAPASVDFVNSKPQIVLTSPGTYLMTAVAGIRGAGGVLTSDQIVLSLRNTTTNETEPGTSQIRSGLTPSESDQVVLHGIVTITEPNQTISLYGNCTTPGAVVVVALATTLTAVKLA